MLDEALTQEAENKVNHYAPGAVRLTFKVGKIGAKGIAGTVNKLFKGSLWVIRKLQGQQGKNIKQLSKDGSQIDMLDPVDKEYTKGFKKYAKKYDVDYSIMRHKDDKSLYTVFFKCKDINKLEKSLEEFCKDKGLDKETLDEKLTLAKGKSQELEKAATKTKTKTKTKNISKKRIQERGR